MMLIRMIDFTWLIDLTGDEVKIIFMKMTLESLKKPLKMTLENPEKSYWDNAGHPVYTATVINLIFPYY